ncbi:MAG: tRNA (guanosine(37)-N1)-methyltransferase TrmD [bacterium]|nr:tRNA (guanosine(37)-N1)-methyltransferase TrmD [bacterium]
MPLFTILTLFPEALDPYLEVGVLGLARRRGLIETRLVDFRDWSRNRHRSVDDRPFGGGPGMVLRPETIVECVEWVDQNYGPHRKLVLCPSGVPFEQKHAAELASDERILLLCGRYEGFDERIFEVLGFEHFSIGDFVLSGGELPALCIVDAVSRLIPGVLGDERSASEDSFQDGDNLDHPHYTRPRVFRGHEVPPILMSGDHKAIDAWRKEQAKTRTNRRQSHVSERPTQTNGDGTAPDSDN